METKRPSKDGHVILKKVAFAITHYFPKQELHHQLNRRSFFINLEPSVGTSIDQKFLFTWQILMNPIGPKQTFCLYTLSKQTCFMTEAYFKSEISSTLAHNPRDCKQQPKQLLQNINFITLAPFQRNFLRKIINGFQQS